MPLAFLLGLLLPTPGSPDPAVAATVWVRVGDRTTGAGWVADRERRWIVTARHVLADQKSADVCFHTAYGGLPVTDRDIWLKHRSALKAGGRIASAKVVATAAAADLVLLQVDHLPADVPALDVVRATVVGTMCHSIGHRHDAPTLWTRTDGVVRQAGRLTDGYFWAGRKLGVGAEVVFAQLPVDLGDSGSPVVDPAGRVIGVVSAIADRTPGLTILVAADEVGRLLDDAGEKKNPPGDAVTESPKVLRATVWVRPQATDGRFAGVVIDKARRLVLTSATAVGTEDVIDVILPTEKDRRLTSEAEAYVDRLGLVLSGHQVRAVVLARDPARDLALLELQSLPPTAGFVTITKSDINVGAGVDSVAHPPGLEFLWLYAAGTVRGTAVTVLQRDPPGEGAKVPSLLLQLPHQGSAAGGPVTNDRGELVTVLSGREAGRNNLAFAPASSAARAFLASVRPLTDPQTASEWYRRGIFLRDRGEPSAGVEVLRQAARLAPGDAVIQATWALAVAETGPSRDTAEALASVQKLADRTPEADALLAAAFSAAGRKVDAARLAKKSLDRDPRQPLALLIRSRSQPIPEAVRTLDDILSLAPSYAPAYRERAERLRSGDSGKEQALADATRAVELAPYDDRARRLRAGLLGDAREWKKAAREYARLVEANPKNADLRGQLARARLKAGEEAAAMEAVTDLVRLDGQGRKAGFTVIREYGGEVLAEDHGVAIRAVDWYRTALRGIRPRLPTADRIRVEDLLREIEKTPAAEATRRMAQALADWEK